MNKLEKATAGGEKRCQTPLICGPAFKSLNEPNHQEQSLKQSDQNNSLGMTLMG